MLPGLLPSIWASNYCETLRMSSYLTIAVVCLLLITEARLKTTFRLTRGLKDKFTNTECVNRNSCSASQCAQYFARCDTESCRECVCDKRMPTFVASQKRCVKDDDIFPRTGRCMIMEIVSTSLSPQGIDVCVKFIQLTACKVKLYIRI